MQILTAKLSIPPLRTTLVKRERLFDKLDQVLERGFALISAPAGYGKTTLVSAWLRWKHVPAAWFTLDDGDNDPARFLAHIQSAVEKIGLSLGDVLEQTLRSDTSTPIETTLIPFINRLSQLEHPVCLVLDDYHFIQNHNIHQLVSFLLEHRPALLYILLATRSDPPLPLARMRARLEMIELRQSDLCFSAQEASDFLTHAMGLEISPQDSVFLTARTEGWIAGLQMAALSMQNTDDIPGFIQALSGSHRYIFDFLLEEILACQPPEIQRFLLYTSILDQLTAPLCDAILKENAQSTLTLASGVILETLERNNLFILPLDHERRWYRYHALFSELLRGYLQRTNSDQIPILHVRASAWFEEQGLIPDAIHHALEAGDWEHVIQLISSNVFALLEQNELSTVARRLEGLSIGKSSTYSWLWLGRAWLAAYMGQLSSVEAILKTVEMDINDQGEYQKLRGQYAAIRAFTAWMGGKREVAISAAREALEYLNPTDYLFRCQSATVLGLSMDDLDESIQAYDQALAYSRACGISHITIFTHGCRAFVLVLQGKLREAYADCQDVLRLTQSASLRQPLPSLSYIYSTMSMVLFEWNDLDAALRYAKEAVALAGKWEQADALHFAYTNLGNALFATGDVEGAFEILRQAWVVAQRTSAWFEEITISQEVELLLAAGNYEAAQQRLRIARVNIDEPTYTTFTKLFYLTSLQLFISQKQYRKALTLLPALLEYAEKKQIVHYIVRVYILQAAAYDGLNQEEQALNSLQKALALTALEGYIRSYLIAGARLIPLLQRSRAAGIFPETVDKILSSLAGADKARLHPAEGDPYLVEPLSERELEVVKLLAQGWTDKKIASILVIARETVHKHLKNIYGKLDVHTRTEAVARARELGYL